MPRRTRAEVEAENLVLYRELESIRDRLAGLLDEEDSGSGQSEDEESDEESIDDADED